MLLIVHKDHATETFFSAGGVHYALQKLNMSAAVPPTQEDRKMADLIVKSVKPNDKPTLTAIADYSLKWFDPTMWKAVVAASGYSLLTFGTEKCLQAWTAFYFETVRPRYVKFLPRYPLLMCLASRKCSNDQPGFKIGWNLSTPSLHMHRKTKRTLFKLGVKFNQRKLLGHITRRW